MGMQWRSADAGQQPAIDFEYFSTLSIVDPLQPELLSAIWAGEYEAFPQAGVRHGTVLVVETLWSKPTKRGRQAGWR